MSKSEFSSAAARRVRKELMLRGATAEQADGYVRKVRETEVLSRGVGQSHHILPVNCGWWKKYRKTKWNRVVVESGLHAELHARLFWIFPSNRSLGQALKFIVINLFSVQYFNDHVIERKKVKILRFYSKNTTLATANKFGLSAKTLTKHLKRWGVARPRGDWKRQLFQERLLKSRSAILKFYMTHTFQETCEEFDTAYKTMLGAFKRMGLHPRTRSEAISLVKQRQKKQRNPAFKASVGNLVEYNRSRSQKARLARAA